METNKPNKPKRHYGIPSCGDPDCYWLRHRLLGLLMLPRYLPWEHCQNHLNNQDRHITT